MANGQPTSTFKISDEERQQFSGDTRIVSVGVTGGLTVMLCPVSIGLSRDKKDLWTLPLEPTVSVRGHNVITERVIAKQRLAGSVKEQWATGDYEITVEGLFIGLNGGDDGAFPGTTIGRLVGLFTSGKALVFDSVLSEAVGIEKMVVKSWEFPATAGVENQRYSFTGVSDQDFELLLK